MIQLDLRKQLCTDLEFPGWTDMDSMKTYVSQVRMCLQGDKSKQALNEHLPQSAINLLFEKFAGRFSPSNSW
jgi:hypothetical protein